MQLLENPQTQKWKFWTVMHGTELKSLYTGGGMLIAMYKISIITELEQMGYLYKCPAVEDALGNLGEIFEGCICIWGVHY